ncbi:hypothetical protein BC941DRAFT_465068 [Chlamydoabsidia padenii]|nr:hypothetical protein BC941DRAFT_465068 [Chlamydoabsidia padenii]
MTSIIILTGQENKRRARTDSPTRPVVMLLNILSNGGITNQMKLLIRAKLLTKEKEKEKAADQGKSVGKEKAASCTIFYGDSGRGYGSRIKGHSKRSTERLQHGLKEMCDLISTKEYLASKLCCLCDSRVMHPQRRNGRANLGVVQCINPDCFERKHRVSLRSRENNAAVNILKIGMYQGATGGEYPAFSASPIRTPTRTTTATANHLADLLFDHPTSWFVNIVDCRPLRREGFT